MNKQEKMEQLIKEVEEIKAESNSSLIDNYLSDSTITEIELIVATALYLKKMGLQLSDYEALQCAIRIKQDPVDIVDYIFDKLDETELKIKVRNEDI